MSLWLKIEDASSLLFSDGVTRVESYQLYLGWQAQQIQNRAIARVWNSDVRLKARINHGRWITDCAACRCGIYTHPEWRLACCGNCGAVYTGVEFPANIEGITRLLLVRNSREHQNWEPGESMVQLRFENVLHWAAVA